jgi:hypothetical protein
VMSNDTIELIRRINPFPADVPAPPFELVLERVDERVSAGPDDERTCRPQRRTHRSAEQPHLGRRPGRLATVAASAGVLLTVAVVGAVVAVVLLDHRTSSSPISARPNAAPIGVVPAGSVSVGPSPAALLSYDGSLWVAGGGYVAHLNPRSGEMQGRTKVPGKTVGTAQLAVGAGGVWVSYTGSSRLLRIDPTTNKLIAQINLPGRPAGGGVAFIDGRVWVSQDAQGARGDVIAINPRTDRVEGAAVPAGAGPAKLASGLGSLWVQNTSSPHGVISEIEPRTRTVRALRFSGGPAVGFGSLWVIPEWFSGHSGPPIRRYDPATRTVISTIRVPRATALAFGDHRVWATTYPRSRSSRVFRPVPGTATVVQINPDTDQLAAKPIQLPGTQPLSIAVVGNDLWIASYSGPLLHYKLTR